jgi:hypothetical protein
MLKLPLLIPKLKAEDFAMYVENFSPEFSVTAMFWSAALQQLSVAEFTNTFCRGEYSPRSKLFLLEAFLSLYLWFLGKSDLSKQILNGNMSWKDQSLNISCYCPLNN